MVILAVLSQWLDPIILEGFFSLNDSVVHSFQFLQMVSLMQHVDAPNHASKRMWKLYFNSVNGLGCRDSEGVS